MNSKNKENGDRNRCLVVLGGSGAIGQSIVQIGSKRGQQVVGTYRDNEPLLAPHEQWVKFDGRDARGLVESVSKCVSVSGALSAIVFCIGRPSTKEDVVVTPVEEFSELFESNVMSFVVCYKALSNLARENGARVAVLSSDATATLRPGNGSYTASKVALEAIAITLAKEEAKHGVRINVIAPSLVDSPMGRLVVSRGGAASGTDAYFANLPWGRALTATEVAEATLNIVLDDQWQYASGQVIRLAMVK